MERNERDETEREAEFAALLRDLEKRYIGFEGVASRIGK